MHANFIISFHKYGLVHNVSKTVFYLQSYKTSESDKSSLRNVVDHLPAEVSVRVNMIKQPNLIALCDSKWNNTQHIL
jgi:hypothetical protein